MEVWKPILGFEGYYEVSSIGRVKSVARRVWVAPSPRSLKGHWRPVKERILRAALRHRYWSVTLWKEHECRVSAVHILVSEAFLGPRPDGQYACHRDDDPYNNRLSNLYWGTPTQNCADKIAAGKQQRGEDIPWSKLTEDDVRWIRRNKGRISQDDMSMVLGISQGKISLIVNGHNWKHVA